MKYQYKTEYINMFQKCDGKHNIIYRHDPYLRKDKVLSCTSDSTSTVWIACVRHIRPSFFIGPANILHSGFVTWFCTVKKPGIGPCSALWPNTSSYRFENNEKWNTVKYLSMAQYLQHYILQSCYWSIQLSNIITSRIVSSYLDSAYVAFSVFQACLG